MLTIFRYYLVQANSELNDMIKYYERLLLDREKEVMTWKDKSSSLESDLRSSKDAKQKLEDQLDNLSTELMKSNGELQDHYQRYDKIRRNSQLLGIDFQNLNPVPTTCPISCVNCSSSTRR